MIELEEYLSQGAAIFLPDGYAAIVADALSNGPLLWWHEVFGAEHFLTIDACLEIDGYVRCFRDSKLVAAITTVDNAPEIEDAAGIWARWQEFLKTDEGRAAATAIAEMKRAAFEEE